MKERDLSFNFVCFFHQEQLNQFKTQTQQELENNTTNYQDLHGGLARYKASLAAVDDIGKSENENRAMLLPLTQSLYVAGQPINSSKLLVDIGTVSDANDSIFK